MAKAKARKKTRKKRSRDSPIAKELEQQGMRFGKRLVYQASTVKSIAMSAGIAPKDTDYVVEFFKPQLEELGKIAEEEGDAQKALKGLDPIFDKIENKDSELMQFIEDSRPEEEPESASQPGVQQVIVERIIERVGEKLQPESPEQIHAKQLAKEEAKREAAEQKAIDDRLRMKRLKSLERGEDGSLAGKDKDKDEGIVFKSKRELALEQEVKELRSAVHLVERQRDNSVEEKKGLQDWLAVMASDLEYHKTLVQSAFSHTDVGNLLLVERRNLAEAAKQGKTGEVPWKDEKGNPVVFANAFDAEHNGIRPLQKKRDKLKDERDNTTDKGRRRKLDEEIIDITGQINTLEHVVEIADDCIVFRSVLDCYQDPTVVARISLDYSKPSKERIGDDKTKDPKIKDADDSDVVPVHKLEGADDLNVVPVQMFTNSIPSKIAGLDGRIYKVFTGGLLARGIERRKKRKTTYKEGEGIVTSDEEIEKEIGEGLDAVLDRELLRNTVEDLRREKTKLEKQAETAEQEKDKALESYTGINEELEKAQNQTSLQQQLIEQYKSDIDKLKNEKGNIERALSESEEAREKTRIEYQQKLDEIQKQVEDLEASAHRSRKVGAQSKEALKRKIASLERKLIDTKATYAKLISEADAECDSLVAVRDKLTQRITELHKRPTQEYMNAVIEELFETHVSWEYVCEELVPVIIGETLADQVSKEQYRQDIRALKAKAKAALKKTKTKYTMIINQFRDNAQIRKDKYLARVKEFVERMRYDRREAMQSRLERIKKYVGSSSILVGKIRKAAHKLSAQGEDNSELRHIVNSVVKRETTDCTPDEVAFITDFYVDKTAEYMHFQEQLAGMKKTIDDTIEENSRAMTELKNDYEAKLRAERGRTETAKAEVEELKGKIKENDEKYKKDLNAQKKETEKANKRAASAKKKAERLDRKHEKFVKKHNDLMDRLSEASLEADADYRKEIYSQKAMNRSLYNLLNRTRDRYADLFLDQDDAKTELLRQLGVERRRFRDEKIRYGDIGIELDAGYRREVYELNEMIGVLRKGLKEAPSDIDDDTAEKIKNGDLEGLEDKLPPNIYSLLKWMFENRPAAEEPADRARAGYFRQKGYSGGDITSWISEHLYSMNERMGEIKGMVVELRRSMFSRPVQCPVFQQSPAQQRRAYCLEAANAVNPN